METPPKQRLHQLIDELPEDEIQAAERCLKSLCSHRDPVLDAIRSAPDVEEPFTEEEQQGVDDAIRDLEAGNRVSDAEVRADLGL